MNNSELFKDLTSIDVRLINVIINEINTWNSAIVAKLDLLFHFSLFSIIFLSIFMIILGLDDKKPVTAPQNKKRKINYSKKQISVFVGILLATLTLVTTIWSAYESRRANNLNEERLKYEMQQYKNKEEK